jgi:uncharacterized membrane protein
VNASDVPRSSSHVRRLRTHAIRDRLRASLLFLPALMLLASIAVEVSVSALDRRFPGTAELPFVLALAPDAAISLLTTIAGATITTAGVVFSILVVSLQLASGQFSPRVLRGFYRDRLGQVLIGLLMSTFGYCVLALSRIDTSADLAPGLTLVVALLLALASIVTIVAYLDRISRHQYVGEITERIARETLELIDELPARAERLGSPVPAPDTGTLGPAFVVPSRTDGWVQQMSTAVMLAAVPPGSVLRPETRVGAYVVRGGPLASVWPPPPDPPAVAAVVSDAVIVGSARTMQQDIDFGLRQLNDIALRALSPAVNDPTTAVEVTLRLASVMRRLLLTDLPAQSVADDADRVLLTPWDLDHHEYIRHAFDQLRHVAAPQVAVSAAVVRTLRMLGEACEDRGRDELLPSLRRQIDLTLEGCAVAGLLPTDLETIKAADRPQAPAHVRLAAQAD